MFKKLKVLGILSLLALLSGCSKKVSFKVVQEVRLELGSNVSSDVLDYLTGSNKEVVSKSAELKELSGVDTNKVGSYKIGVEYKGDIKEVNVVVEDTTAPTFSKFTNRVSTEEGIRSDYSGLYIADDLSEVTVKVDDSKVDYNKSGEYTIVVSASDMYGNNNTKEAKVVVTKVTEELSTNDLKKIDTTNSSVVSKDISKKDDANKKEASSSKPSVTNKDTTVKEDKKTNSNTPVKDKVPNGKGISLRKNSLKNPSNFNFGKYQEYANTLYKAILNDENFSLSFDFDSHEDGVAFTNLFNSRVLPIEVCLYEVHYTSQERGEDGEWYKVTRVDYDSSTRSGNINLKKALSVSYNACVSAGLYNGMSEREAVNKINNWICNKMTYTSVDNGAYEGFTTGKGKCRAYAEMFKSMCDTAGIRCEYITGRAKGPHAWNRVNIGGTWYYVDTCWNDTGSNRTEYLLSKTLWSSHKM